MHAAAAAACTSKDIHAMPLPPLLLLLLPPMNCQHGMQKQCVMQLCNKSRI